MVGAIGGIGGLAIGVVSAVIAASAKRDSRASAEASRDSADEAAKTRRIDADLQHDHLQPEPPAEIKTELREGTLFGTIRLPRDYRTAATGIYQGGGQHPIEIRPVLLRGGRDYEFPIEVWPGDRTVPKTEEIRFRFWPPAADDDVPPWTCRCGESVEEGDRRQGHWEWAVPVAVPPAGAFGK